MAWKDVTGYSQGDRLKQPKSWELRFGNMRIVLTQHISEPGVWFTKCEPFYDLHQIGKVGDDVDALKKVAIEKAALSMKAHGEALAAIAANL